MRSDTRTFFNQQEAIELIKKATETDNEQKYEEALPLYSKAIELFLQVYKGQY